MPTQRHPVHRETLDALAVCGETALTAWAFGAAGMPGHHHALAGRHTSAVADLDDLRHALVTDREGTVERRCAGDDRAIEIASGGGDRPDDRVLVRAQPRLRDLAELNPTATDERQLAHGDTARCQRSAADSVAMCRHGCGPRRGRGAAHQKATPAGRC